MKNFTAILAGLALTAGCLYTGAKLFTPATTTATVTEETRMANFIENTSYVQIEDDGLFDCVSYTLHDANTMEIIPMLSHVTEMIARDNCAG